MRTAISASPRSRSSTRLDSTSSIVTPGLARRNSASSGGNTSAPMISLAVMRTTPAASLVPPEAARIIEPAAAAIACACGAMSRAASVGIRPRCDRMNSAVAQLALELGDLPTQRRLGRGRGRGPPRKACRRARRREKRGNGSNRVYHTNMYIKSRILGNFRMTAGRSMVGTSRQQTEKTMSQSTNKIRGSLSAPPAA